MTGSYFASSTPACKGTRSDMHRSPSLSRFHFFHIRPAISMCACLLSKSFLCSVERHTLCLQLEWSRACGEYLTNQSFNFECKCRNDFCCVKIWFYNCSCEACGGLWLFYGTPLPICVGFFFFMERELKSNGKLEKAISKMLTMDGFWNWIHIVFINII